METPLCERCEDKYDRERPATYIEGPYRLCDDCRDAEAEAAHEAFLDSYYGGCGPQSIQEQCDAAAEQRRQLRRLD